MIMCLTGRRGCIMSLRRMSFSVRCVVWAVGLGLGLKLDVGGRESRPGLARVHGDG